MATYSTLAATLAAMRDTRTDPQGTEDAGKIDDALRQTRTWLYDFLSTIIDESTNKIRPTAFATSSGSSLPASIIRGTNPANQQAREIAQKSIQAADIADGVLTSQQMADGGISGSKFVDGSIQGAKLADASITSSKIASQIFGTASIVDGSVTTPKYAPGSITNDKLADNTILGPKMGPRSIAGPNLPVAGLGQILVGGNGPSANELAIRTLGGAISINADGIATITAGIAGGIVSFCRLAEITPNGVSAGSSAASTWNRRGGIGTKLWSILNQTRAFLEVVPSGGGVVQIKEGGLYWFRLVAPAYDSAGNHKVRLVFAPVTADARTWVVYYGTSVNGITGANTYSEVTGLITVPTVPTGSTAFPLLWVDHWTSAAKATTGLGIAISATSDTTESAIGLGLPPEIYADLTILRVQETIS